MSSTATTPQGQLRLDPPDDHLELETKPATASQGQAPFWEWGKEIPFQGCF